MCSHKCKHCNHEIQYSPCANFILICPNCLNAYLDCEYGYGPVVPCRIFLGEKEIGVIETRGYLYLLKTQYSDEIIELENKYLEALEEAIAVIKGKITA